MLESSATGRTRNENLGSGPQGVVGGDWEMKRPMESIGGFELLSEVEESPLGCVYLGLDTQSELRPALVWVFDGANMVGADSLRELASPAEGPFPNPCLAEFTRCGLDRGVGFAAYERLNGVSLSRVVQRCAETATRMPVDLGLLITTGMAAALETAIDGASSEPTTHGCLVPDFVLLLKDGPTCLFGFEIAHALHHWERAQEQATPLSRYLSPEVREGASPEPDSDVYSLGSSLFELLAGKPLPLDESKQRWAIEEEVEAGTFPGDVAKLIKHSLVDREQRWPNASVWRQRARKAMRTHDYQPSGDALDRFLDTLFEEHFVDLPDTANPTVQEETTLKITSEWTVPIAQTHDDSGIELEAPEPVPAAVPALAASKAKGLHWKFAAGLLGTTILTYLLLSSILPAEDKLTGEHQVAASRVSNEATSEATADQAKAMSEPELVYDFKGPEEKKTPSRAPSRERKDPANVAAVASARESAVDYGSAAGRFGRCTSAIVPPPAGADSEATSPPAVAPDAGSPVELPGIDSMDRSRQRGLRQRFGRRGRGQACLTARTVARWFPSSRGIC